MDEHAQALAAFQEELAYLREASLSFARQHPKLAERLEFSRDGSSDPHVDRLIESFALLTSRIQRRFDADFPEFTTALLGLLYPNLVDPIPPMTVARIFADPARGKLTSGYTVPRHTQLFAQTATGLTCRFRTAYPTTLWPLQVVHADFANKAHFDFLDADNRTTSVLRLRLESRGAAFSDLELKHLRFHLNGSAHLTGRLYELLFRNCIGIALHNRVTGHAVTLPTSHLKPVGFGPQDDVIPYPLFSHPGYRLLQEYFWLPEKFLFFDLTGLERNPSIIDLDILFLLDTAPRERLVLDRDTFALGCTPVVNLFPRTSEPIRVDHTRTDYRLIADARREPTTEIHSVLSVSSSSNPLETSRHLRHLYSTAGPTLPGDAFWYTRRVMSERLGISGTDVSVAFVDLAFNPAPPPPQTAFAHMLCTNRDLALQLPENARLQTEEPGPIGHIHCLRKPSASGYPPLAGASRWALISNLNLNHLSLSSDPAALDALKKVLSFYSLSNGAVTQQQIDRIDRMTVRRVTRRVGKHPWQSFKRSWEVDLHLEGQDGKAYGNVLFLAVLEKFLDIFAGINSTIHLKSS
jgi:type VI secretion system protein ImpG